MVNYLIDVVCEFDQDLMPPGRKTLHNDRIPASVCPMPPRIIDAHVDVPNPSRPRYRLEVQILSAIPNEDNAARQRFGEGRIHDDPGWCLISEGLDRRLIHSPREVRGG
jgi:hypothetical protein